MTAGLCKPFTQVKIGSLLRWVDETDDGSVYDYTNDSVRPGAFGLMRCAIGQFYQTRRIWPNVQRNCATQLTNRVANEK